MVPLVRRAIPAVLVVSSLGAFASAADARTYTYDGLRNDLTYQASTWAAGGTAGSPRAEKLTWTQGRRRAVARGTLIVRRCGASCAQATFEKLPGTITFTRPATCRLKDGPTYRYFRTARFTPEHPKGDAASGDRTTVIRFTRRQLDASGCRR